MSFDNTVFPTHDSILIVSKIDNNKLDKYKMQLKIKSTYVFTVKFHRHNVLFLDQINHRESQKQQECR